MEIWMYNGTRQDGKLVSYAARSEGEYSAYIDNGCIDIDKYDDRFGKIDLKAEVKKGKSKKGKSNE